MLFLPVTRSKTNKLRVIAHAAHCWAEEKIKLLRFFRCATLIGIYSKKTTTKFNSTLKLDIWFDLYVGPTYKRVAATTVCTLLAIDGCIGQLRQNVLWCVKKELNSCKSVLRKCPGVIQLTCAATELFAGCLIQLQALLWCNITSYP